MREPTETTINQAGVNDMKQENNNPYQWVKEAAQFKHAAQLFALATLQQERAVVHALYHRTLVKEGAFKVPAYMNKHNKELLVPLSSFASDVWHQLEQMGKDVFPKPYIHQGMQYIELLARLHVTMKSNGFDKEELAQMFNHAEQENVTAYTSGMNKWGAILQGLDLTWCAK